MNTTRFCSFVNLLFFCYKASNLFDLCFNTPYSYIFVSLISAGRQSSNTYFDIRFDMTTMTKIKRQLDFMETFANFVRFAIPKSYFNTSYGNPVKN